MNQGCHMGRLRSVGSIKLYGSFAEYRLFYRDFLPKRPIIVSILLTEATPYHVGKMNDLCHIYAWVTPHHIWMRDGGPYMRDVTSYVICHRWYVMCDITHSCLKHDALVCEVTHSYMRLGVMSHHIWMCHDETCMGWLWLVGSLKL